MLDKTSTAALTDAIAQTDICDHCNEDFPSDQIIRRYGRENGLSGRDKDFICKSCVVKERAEIEMWCAS